MPCHFKCEPHCLDFPDNCPQCIRGERRPIIRVCEWPTASTVGELPAEPGNHYCTFDISENTLSPYVMLGDKRRGCTFWFLHFLNSALWFAEEPGALHTYTHTRTRTLLVCMSWLSVDGHRVSLPLVSALNSQRRQKYSITLAMWWIKWTVTRTKATWQQHIKQRLAPTTGSHTPTIRAPWLALAPSWYITSAQRKLSQVTLQNHSCWAEK